MHLDLKDFGKPEIILAIVAIIFATIQFIDARLEHRALVKQEKRMVSLANSMSTRFIGDFPKNMGEIVDVVSRSDSHLDIITDLVAYGHYSRPSLFEGYFRAIRTKCEAKMNVRMIVYSRALYVGLFERQFPRESFATMKSSERFRVFFDVANRGLPKPTKWEEFRDTLRQAQARHIDEALRMGVKIRCIDSEVLMSLWLEDNEDAVFSFQNIVEREREVSFRTRDGSLIGTLQKQFDLTWASARETTSEDLA